MNALRPIREALRVTQSELASALGCTQGNVSAYEKRGQTLPPETARKLIDYARERGFPLTFDDVYAGPSARPEFVDRAAREEARASA